MTEYRNGEGEYGPVIAKDYKNDKKQYHRVNGPAMVWEDGDGAWWYNGKRHRYYGPAIKWRAIDAYWIFGEKLI